MGIGIYQGCFRSRQLTTNEFLIADGRMKVIRIVIINKRDFVSNRFYQPQ